MEYNQDPNLEELYHHGIKGMRWGVRRSPTQLGKGRKPVKKKSPSKTPAVKKEAPKAKTNNELTDEELRERINRKRLENDYNALYPRQVSAGKRFVDAAMNKVIVPAAQEAGKQLLKELLVSQGKKALNLPSGGDSKK